MSNVMLLAGTINLSGSWGQVWGAVQAAIGTKLTTLLSAVGVILVVGAVFKWLFERRRGVVVRSAGRPARGCCGRWPPGRPWLPPACSSPSS